MSDIYHSVIAEQKYPKKHTYAKVLVGVNIYEIHIQNDRNGKEEIYRFGEKEEAVETFTELVTDMETYGELPDYDIQHPTHINIYGKGIDL